MRKKVLILTGTILLLTLVLAIPASACKTTKVSGAFAVRDLTDKLVPMGDRCFVQVWYYMDLSGDITGTCAIHERQIAQGPCEGSFPGSYKETLSLEAKCTEVNLQGQSGTFRLLGHGEILPAADPPAPFVMHWREDCVVFSGTGGLANLHGSLTLESHPDQPPAYSGQIYFGGKERPRH